MTFLRALRRHLDRRRFRYRLAACAIFKDEAAYLDEWLTFHAGVGVDHFYLYDNASSDAFRPVLAPWIASGKVTLVDWPRPSSQTAAYDDCLRRARRQARWVAFFDIDEFLFSPGGRALPSVLEPYDDLPAVFVYWRLYGSSGHQTPPAGPVLEAFTRRLGDEEAEHVVPAGTTGKPRQGKSIVNPRAARRMGVHLPMLRYGIPLDERRRPVPMGDEPPARMSCDVLRLNHYWSRSIADLVGKSARGRADGGRPNAIEAALAWESQLNAVEDPVIVSLWRAITGGRDKT